jgi:Family of unknown function (DUF6804)
MKRNAGLYIAWLVVAGLLVFAAVERHPYSYYTLLRWICCPVFAYSAFAAYEKNRVLWVWVFGINISIVFICAFPVDCGQIILPSGNQQRFWRDSTIP